MSEPQLFIDPECRLSRVPYVVPNNTHYVEYEDYARLKAEVKALRAELADAQESNHILNEIIAMMRKEGKQ